MHRGRNRVVSGKIGQVASRELPLSYYHPHTSFDSDAVEKRRKDAIGGYKKDLEDQMRGEYPTPQPQTSFGHRDVFLRDEMEPQAHIPPPGQRHAYHAHTFEEEELEPSRPREYVPPPRTPAYHALGYLDDYEDHWEGISETAREKGHSIPETVVRMQKYLKDVEEQARLDRLRKERMIIEEEREKLSERPLIDSCDHEKKPPFSKKVFRTEPSANPLLSAGDEKITRRKIISEGSGLIDHVTSGFVSGHDESVLMTEHGSVSRKKHHPIGHKDPSVVAKELVEQARQHELELKRLQEQEDKINAIVTSTHDFTS
eukprot:TRINITY_DN15595_c0_g1_i1.p1 TRINITY_DN15595_c0_g1~~TRINITY_DN15595_c0_g1_i1.p1  ORF type:complete len:354 (-),score=111.45 TRINITY_DN15595_c0_g1_i1:42-986(-)